MKEASNSIFAFSGKQIAKEAAITLFFFFFPQKQRLIWPQLKAGYNLQRQYIRCILYSVGLIKEKVNIGSAGGTASCQIQ